MFIRATDRLIQRESIISNVFAIGPPCTQRTAIRIIYSSFLDWHPAMTSSHKQPADKLHVTLSTDTDEVAECGRVKHERQADESIIDDIDCDRVPLDRAHAHTTQRNTTSRQVIPFSLIMSSVI